MPHARLSDPKCPEFYLEEDLRDAEDIRTALEPVIEILQLRWLRQRAARACAGAGVRMF